MTDKVIENNQAAVMGKIISGFTFSHEIFGEGFYMMDVEVARLSESYHPGYGIGAPDRRGCELRGGICEHLRTVPFV